MYGLWRTAKCTSSGGVPRANTGPGALNPAARRDPAVETPIIWAGAQMMSWIRCLPPKKGGGMGLGEGENPSWQPIGDTVGLPIEGVGLCFM